MKPSFKQITFAYVIPSFHPHFSVTVVTSTVVLFKLTRTTYLKIYSRFHFISTENSFKLNRFSSSFPPVCCGGLRDILVESETEVGGGGDMLCGRPHTDVLYNKLHDIM